MESADVLSIYTVFLFRFVFLELLNYKVNILHAYTASLMSRERREKKCKLTAPPHIVWACRAIIVQRLRLAFTAKTNSFFVCRFFLVHASSPNQTATFFIVDVCLHQESHEFLKYSTKDEISIRIYEYAFHLVSSLFFAVMLPTLIF